jgi:hypothetical protein
MVEIVKGREAANINGKKLTSFYIANCIGYYKRYAVNNAKNFKRTVVKLVHILTTKRELIPNIRHSVRNFLILRDSTSTCGNISLYALQFVDCKNAL